ncbi:MAG: 30S ribosomal protein S15 [Nanobdellota archaeon]
MARMHSRDKGQSGSKKPAELEKPSWVRYKEKEIEMIVTKLAKEGKSMSEIGAIMRDRYGIPSIRQVTGKKVLKIIEEKNLAPELPEDLLNLLRRVNSIRKHRETNRQDMTAKRGLMLTESKILRLVKYYKKAGKLPADWKYDPKNLSMYV